MWCSCRLTGVRCRERPEEMQWREVTLDSAADLSVLPMSFVNVGVAVEDDQGMRMVDAQARRSSMQGSRKRLS